MLFLYIYVLFNPHSHLCSACSATFTYDENFGYNGCTTKTNMDLCDPNVISHFVVYICGVLLYGNSD
jgi:hypothetical protein